ncbi:hypothetical protein BJX99DRAFT_223452 [Aspergillus californicus]
MEPILCGAMEQYARIRPANWIGCFVAAVIYVLCYRAAVVSFLCRVCVLGLARLRLSSVRRAGLRCAENA